MRPLLLMVVIASPAVAQQPSTAPDLAELIDQLVDPERAARAQIRLYRLGAQAAPALIGALLRAPERWYRADDDRQHIARAAAIRVLHELGPRAVAVLPDLNQALRDRFLEPHRVQIGDALGQIAPYAPKEQREDLLDELWHLDRAIYKRVDEDFWGELYSRLTFDARAAVPELLDGLSDPCPYVCEVAAEALMHRSAEVRGKESLRADTVVALERAIDVDYREQREWQWGVMGRQMRYRVSTLHVQRIRAKLAQALARIDGERPSAVLGHAALLYHLDPAIRIEAAQALARQGPAAVDCVPWLLETARSDEPTVATEALLALGTIGPFALAAADDLAAMAAGPAGRRTRVAEQALRRICPDWPRRPGYDLPPALALRIGAVLAGDAGEAGFDMPAEIRRLGAWLARDDGANRRLVHQAPRAILHFCRLSEEEGGPLNRDLQWVPRLVARDLLRPNHWQPSWAETPLELPWVVAAHTPEQCGDDRRRGVGVARIVELIPVDRRGGIDVADLDPATLRAGGRSVTFIVRRDRDADIRTWWSQQLGRPVARVLEGTCRDVRMASGHWNEESTRFWLPVYLDDAAEAQAFAFRLR